MTEHLEGQMSIFDLDIWSGKMSLAHCQVQESRTEKICEGKISESYLKKPQKSQTKMPLFLDLRGEQSGLQADASWEMGGLLLGEYTMRSFGEYPSEERESRLSQILEDNPHPKYYLSAKACQGILRRAQSRGKALPKILEQVLLKQSHSKNEPDAMGGGKGILIQNERTGALSTLNNQSVCCLNDQGGSVMGVSEDITGALRAQEHGHQPIVYGISANCFGVDAYNQTLTGDVAITSRAQVNNEHIPCVIEGNGSRPSHHGDGYKQSETMYTLNSTEQHAVCIENKPQGSSWDGGQISPTLTANNANGAQRMPDKDNFNAVITYGLDRASFNQGQNAQYDFSVTEELAQTLVAKGPGGY